jgi:hypothetical protein
MKKEILVLIFCIFFSISTKIYAQTTCQMAVYQVQNYVNNINYSYNNSMRWIMYNVHPYHRNRYIHSLNNWYIQHTNYANNLYYQIQAECSLQRNPNQGGEINSERQPDDVVLNPADQNKTMRKRINIPETAKGWQPIH